MNMKMPANLAREVEIEKVKKAVQSHQRSKIHDKFLVTFVDVDARDSIKSYANGIATVQGQAALLSLIHI